MKKKVCYDMNFIGKNFYFENTLKSLFDYLFLYTNFLNISIIKNKKIKDYNENISIFGEKEQKKSEIILSKINLDEILKNNIVTDVLLNLEKNINLHISLNFYKDISNNIFNKISLYFNVQYFTFPEKKLLDYLEKFIKIINPEIVNIGEELPPISIQDILKGEKDFGDYIYINKIFIDNNNKFKKIHNGYLLNIKKCDIDFINIINDKEKG